MRDAPPYRGRFTNATAAAAASLGMHGVVHWDVDRFLDRGTTARTEAVLRRYAGSAVRGVFQLASDPLPPANQTPTWLLRAGAALPVFKPAVAYTSNATAIAAALARQQPASLSYAYLTLGSDTALVDAVAAAVATGAPHVRLVGYRELIALAQQKRARVVGEQVPESPGPGSQKW